MLMLMLPLMLLLLLLLLLWLWRVWATQPLCAVLRPDTSGAPVCASARSAARSTTPRAAHALPLVSQWGEKEHRTRTALNQTVVVLGA
jgi:hypothetical protein